MNTTKVFNLTVENPWFSSFLVNSNPISRKLECCYIPMESLQRGKF